MSWENYGSVLENGSLFASSQRGSFDESNKQMGGLEYDPTKKRKNGSQGLLKADADHHGSLLYTLLEFIVTIPLWGQGLCDSIGTKWCIPYRDSSQVRFASDTAASRY
jgi:hypothetical protein